TRAFFGNIRPRSMQFCIAVQHFRPTGNWVVPAGRLEGSAVSRVGLENYLAAAAWAGALNVAGWLTSARRVQKYIAAAALASARAQPNSVVYQSVRPVSRIRLSKMPCTKRL